MPRYRTTPTKIGKGNKSLLQTTRYVDIPLSFDDVYIFTTIGDRYDTLALSYYGKPSMWWIIAISNPNLPSDSLIPPIGSQIRIPNIQTANQILNLYS